MKRILIVNVNWRGDVLFSTPFIRAIREKYPDSFIASLVVPRCGPVLENNPHLDEIIIFDDRGRHKGLLGRLNLIRLLRSKHFDTAFLLHRSLTRTLICWLAAIPERVGYYTRKRALFLTKKIMPANERLHKVEYFLNIACAFDIVTGNKDYEFHPSLEDRDYINKLFEDYGLRENDFLVVINPGGNWDLKRWPEENFARLCDRLIEKYKAKIIITGSERDFGLAEDITKQMKGQTIIFCGKTSLGELAALMAKVDLVISGDSGPMHIAVSQGTKTIALFGPTSQKVTGPFGRGDYTVIQKDVGCDTPCYQLDCNDNRCMKAITVEDVLKEVNRKSRFFA